LAAWMLRNGAETERSGIWQERGSKKKGDFHRGVNNKLVKMHWGEEKKDFHKLIRGLLIQSNLGRNPAGEHSERNLPRENKSLAGSGEMSEKIKSEQNGNGESRLTAEEGPTSNWGVLGGGGRQIRIP